MDNGAGLLGELQQFLDRRKVAVATLDAPTLVGLMVDWYRLVPVDARADGLLHQYGGWSEGCVTGFKWSVLRHVLVDAGDPDPVERFAGLTLMLEPSAFSGVSAVRFETSDRNALEAFVRRIEASPAWDAVAAARPMGVVLQSGGLR